MPSPVLLLQIFFFCILLRKFRIISFAGSSARTSNSTDELISALLIISLSALPPIGCVCTSRLGSDWMQPGWWRGEFFGRVAMRVLVVKRVVSCSRSKAIGHFINIQFTNLLATVMILFQLADSSFPKINFFFFLFLYDIYIFTEWWALEKK